ncbi:trypsin-like peptidase domain-containing protein [Terrabacter sp. NPDC080008]|uniref:S1C family serine protease n=1 Tax=Terrabacter sp. NPDC080008 TaxID=3155176 RepID=UPI00344BEBC3
MSTAGKPVRASETSGTSPVAPPRRSRLRRGTLALAAALALGLAAAGPALATGTGPHSATVRDWQGWSTAQAGSGYGSDDGSGYGWGDGSGYGSAQGSGPTAQAATAAESAGVVLIDTTLPYQNGQAAGTGMVLTSGGQVLTNYHVVHGAGSIRVTVAATGQTYRATVIGSDEAHDVALIQLTGASGLTTIKPDTDGVSVGSQVTAVGNAGGTGTLTAAAGQITSTGASVTARSEDGTSPETLDGMLETNADVQAGDSGGPLFDAQGEVVGIDTAGSSGGTPDAYAIPITRALSIADQIRSGHGTSTVRIGPAAFLGVEVGNSPSSGDYGYGSDGGDGYGAYGGYGATTPGAQVSGVLSGAAAADAGLQAGDVITSLNGHPITSADDVSAALVGANPGDHVDIAWTSQDGTQHTSTVTLGASPVA